MTMTAAEFVSLDEDLNVILGHGNHPWKRLCTVPFIEHAVMSTPYPHASRFMPAR